MKSPQALFCFKFLLLLSAWSFWSCNNNRHERVLPKGESDLVFAQQLKNRGSYDSAIIFFRKGIDFNLKNNQYSEWGKNISGMIDCFRAKGDLDEAMRLTEQALAVAVTKTDTTGNLYNGLIHKKANLLSDKRQFDQAEAFYLRNIKTYELKSASPDTGLALSYNGLGTVYLL